jgi:hypothetical protein
VARTDAKQARVSHHAYSCFYCLIVAQRLTHTLQQQGSSA